MMGNWGNGPGMGFYGGGFWGNGIFGMLFQLVFWVAIIGLGVYLFRRFGSRVPTGGSFQVNRSNSALDILRERYARGEIGRDEYEERARDLQKQSGNDAGRLDKRPVFLH